MPIDEREVAEALYQIPPDERETRVRMAFAVKNGLGERGFDVWLAWSERRSTSPTYKRRDAVGIWRSAKPTGGVTVLSLFKEAREHGWRGMENPDLQRQIRERQQEARSEHRRMEIDAQERAQRAQTIAQNALRAAPRSTHPYLEEKGFPDLEVFVDRIRFRRKARPDAPPDPDVVEWNVPWDQPGRHVMLVPMRTQFGRRLEDVRSVQMIEPDGQKWFLPGASASGTVHRFGGWNRDVFVVEGFATGLSVSKALREILRDRDSQVLVAFSAYGTYRVATDIAPGWRKGNVYVLADNDPWICSAPKDQCGNRWYGRWPQVRCPQCGRERPTPPAGERHARQTGLPWWAPPDAGSDANDYHLDRGIDELAGVLRGLRLKRG